MQIVFTFGNPAIRQIVIITRQLTKNIAYVMHGNIRRVIFDLLNDWHNCVGRDFLPFRHFGNISDGDNNNSSDLICIKWSKKLEQRNNLYNHDADCYCYQRGSDTYFLSDLNAVIHFEYHER